MVNIFAYPAVTRPLAAPLFQSNANNMKNSLQKMDACTPPFICLTVIHTIPSYARVFRRPKVFIQNVASASNVPQDLQSQRDSAAVNLSEYQGKVLQEGSTARRKGPEGRRQCAE